jgi:glyoxylase-like metal-dependent hydrolase (beta-lactamase superfamily II)
MRHLLSVTLTEKPLVTRQEVGHLNRIASGVAGLQVVMVNVYFAGHPGGEWVLIDAGLYGSAKRIRHAAEKRFGRSRPSAILLTHGHFDHVGSLKELAEYWDVPIYAHRLEMPYLTGKSKYPPPDPMVGRGSFALMSPLYPRGPIDIGSRAMELPADNSVPHLGGWRWIHTPGHTAGHVSFFRDADRVLIAGDAFVTTKQESLYSVITQRLELNGPPAYYTSDWDAARDSVKRLAALRPAVMATGHGLPMAGVAAADQLEQLASSFDRVARPKFGRYSREGAVANSQGVVSVPSWVGSPAGKLGLSIGGGLLLGSVVVGQLRRRSKA